MYDGGMDVYPIHFIHHDDISFLGREIVDLSSIKRLGFPVPDGIVLIPPQLPFTTILKAYKTDNRDIFEQRLEIIRKEVFAIPLPESLSSHLKNHAISAKVVWHDCLQRWIEQVRSRVWRFGVTDELVNELTPIPIFFTGKHTASGRAYFESSERKIVIEVVGGELDGDFQDRIKKIIEDVRKKVLTNYVFDWAIADKKVVILRVYPYTESASVVEPVEKIEFQKTADTVGKTKSILTSMKIYADFSEGMVFAEDIDGVFISSEKIGTDDERILKLVESALLVREDVIFQLSDVRSLSDISSAIRLIHQPEILEKELRLFQFAKLHYSKSYDAESVKRSLYNLQIGIPLLRSAGELLALKEQMKSRGIEIRANQKLWVNLSVPENWIQLDAYLQVCFSGVVIDIDELYGFLIGEQHFSQSQFYQFDSNLIFSFLAQYFKKLHAEKIPILLTGSKVLELEMVQNAITHGINGVILKHFQISGARAFVASIEKKHIMKKSIELSK